MAAPRSNAISLAATLSLAVVFPGGAAWAEPWKAIPELQGRACVRQLEKVLAEWDSAFEWDRGPMGPAESVVYRSPTGSLGAWTEVWIHTDKSLEARFTTAASTLSVQWKGPDCRPAMGVKQRTFGPPPPNGSFTDEDLRALVKQHRAGVIYAWSPAMPISMAGLQEMRKAARALGVPVIGVLDPEADAVIAEAEARRNGLAKEDLRQVDSLELMNRGVHVHYPAAVMFADGKIVGPRLPGHATADEYRAFLEPYLAAAKPR